MKRIFVLVCLVSTAGLAQERGRTDGPEGSEYGKGGYQSHSESRFSLELNWGASVSEASPLGGVPAGPPLFAGLTGSFWMDDWFLMDVSAAYLLNNQRLNLLVGPRFRTGFYPVSAHVGLQAGAMVAPNVGLRFGLSPKVGGDILMADKFLLGLGYAMDIAIGGDGVAHRIYMNIGYRF